MLKAGSHYLREYSPGLDPKVILQGHIRRLGLGYNSGAVR